MTKEVALRFGIWGLAKSHGFTSSWPPPFRRSAHVCLPWPGHAHSRCSGSGAWVLAEEQEPCAALARKAARAQRPWDVIPAGSQCRVSTARGINVSSNEALPGLPALGPVRPRGPDAPSPAQTSLPVAGMSGRPAVAPPERAAGYPLPHPCRATRHLVLPPGPRPGEGREEALPGRRGAARGGREPVPAG